MSGRTKGIIHGAIQSYLIKGASLLLSFFLMPVYMIYIPDASDLGVWFTILSIINWFLLFDLGAGNGLRNCVVEALSKRNRHAVRELISSAYFFTFCIAALLAMLIVAVLEIIRHNLCIQQAIGLDFRYISVIEIVAAGVLLQLVLRLCTSLLYAIQQPAYVNLASLISNGLILLLVNLSNSFVFTDKLVALAWINVISLNLPLVFINIILFKSIFYDCRPSFNYVHMRSAKRVLGIGLRMLVLSLLWQIVSSSHSVLITMLIGPEEVVDYQIYFKLYNTGAGLITLALVPLWSAVTKAFAEKDIDWIIRIHRFMLILPIASFILSISSVFFVQNFVDIWLGQSSIVIDYFKVFTFSLYVYIFVSQSVNSSFENGLNRLTVQTVCMVLAIPIMLISSFALTSLINNWSGIVLSMVIALIPYSVVSPLSMNRFLNAKKAGVR